MTGDIIRAVKDAFSVVGPARIENVVADASAVKTGFIVSQAADVQTCPLDSFLYIKFFTKQRGWVVLVKFLIAKGRRLAVIDPFSLPIIRLEQGHLPESCLTPG